MRFILFLMETDVCFTFYCDKVKYFLYLCIYVISYWHNVQDKLDLGPAAFIFYLVFSFFTFLSFFRPRCSSSRLLLAALCADRVPGRQQPGREGSAPSGRGQTQRPDAPHRGLRHPGRGRAFPCESASWDLSVFSLSGLQPAPFTAVCLIDRCVARLRTPPVRI